MELRSYDVFGSKVTPMTRPELLALLKAHVEGTRQCVIAYANLHGMRVRMHDASIDELHALPQTFVHIDGMPIVWLCRALGIAARREHRLTLVDWIWQLLEVAAQERWRVYYVGATEAVLRAGVAAIAARLPTLELCVHHGFFDSSDARADDGVVRDIAAFRPDLVLVGMGMGRQERWIKQHLDAVAPASVCALGACMEYLAGAVRTPPRWSGQLGLEWLFRLAENPARFWQRYLVEPWFVLAHILRTVRWSTRKQAAAARTGPEVEHV
jgi:N-acetylglucosaminyldiphosphoundecaprenol N-acetyl-beta-D-mannosaminyltransferase